jgi:octopine/nopaline transport system substrate-binding protein
MTFTKTVSLALLCAGLAAGGASAQTKTLKIATEGAYAPYNFTGAGGKLEGFEIDLANDLCKRMKVTCEIVAQDWDGIIPALNAKKYDAIMAGMNDTEERRKIIAFSRPYAVDQYSFGTMKDSPLAKLAGTGEKAGIDKDPAAAEKLIEAWKPLLKGKTIGVQGSTTNANFIDKYFKGIAEIREYKTTEQHDLDLSTGRVDAIFASQGALKATMDKPEFANMAIVGAGMSGGVLGRGVAVGLRKDESTLKIAFDTAIEAAVKDGTITKLTEKWFKVSLTPDS